MSGTHDVSDIAPALQPASAAPASHAASTADHTAVPRRVEAQYGGLPPER